MVAPSSVSVKWPANIPVRATDWVALLIVRWRVASSELSESRARPGGGVTSTVTVTPGSGARVSMTEYESCVWSALEKWMPSPWTTCENPSVCATTTPGVSLSATLAEMPATLIPL